MNSKNFSRVPILLFCVAFARPAEARALQDSQVPNPISVAGQAQTVKLIRQTPPQYPLLAQTAHVSGTVRLHAIVGTDGTIKDLHVLSGPPLLIQSAIDAVRQWQYAPTLVEGKPVEVDTTISVVYTLRLDSTGTESIAPDDGSVLGDQYFSKFFKFTYPVPSGWISYDAKEMESMAGVAGKSLHGGDSTEQGKPDVSPKRTFVLLTLSQSPIGTPGKDTRVITVFAERVPDGSEIRSAEDYLLKIQKLARDMKASLQFPGKPHEVSFDGRQFFQIDGQASTPGGLFYQSTVATVLQGYVLSFMFTSASQDDLNSLGETLKLIHFDADGR
jgi:TonB family protein